MPMNQLGLMLRMRMAECEKEEQPSKDWLRGYLQAIVHLDELTKLPGLNKEQTHLFNYLTNKHAAPSLEEEDLFQRIQTLYDIQPRMVYLNKSMGCFDDLMELNQEQQAQLLLAYSMWALNKLK